LRSFQHRLGEFDQRGIRVVAISADPPDASKRHRQKLGYTFPILSDAKLDVIKQYDLLHPGGGPHKADISRPAEILVDSTGTVRWVNLTDNIAVRARPDEALAAFDKLNVSHD
jgi:peroxiredoxin